MAKVECNSTDNPKLGQKRLSDGRLSLYLEYYYGYSMVYDEVSDKMKPKKDRERKTLNLYIWESPRTPIERQTNKETLELAKKIRFEEEQKLKEDTRGYRLKKSNAINFLDYFQAYNDSYTKKDIRMMQIALQRFKDFLKIDYPQFVHTIKPEQITRDMITAFTEYLQTRSVGEGAQSIYQRFKKVIKHAIEHDLMIKNPCMGISIKVDSQTLKKDVLSFDEIQAMISTTYENQNQNIRRAFIFCLYTGIRFCDVVELQYKNVRF